NKVEEIDLADASSGLQSEVANFSAVKRETGKSPIQLRAEYNAEVEDGFEVAGKVVATVGVILLFAPDGTVTKVASIGVAGLGVAIAYGSDTIENDPERISFEREY
ncbi:MAG: hypothetical protein D6732_23700, partial [Methanobacteriota archaeon]